jgi:hypothetical protein
MSTIDQPRPSSDKWERWGRDAGSIVTDATARAGRLCTAAGRQLRDNRPLRTSLLAAIAAWIVLELLFVAWVHRSLEGHAHRAFLPGTWFMEPALETAAGLQAVCKFGYDGQQYYRESNDIFGRRDAYKHIDNVMYRYQRIGMPMLAGGLASLLGYELTPPMLYHTLNFGLVACGFGVLVYWLMINQLHPAYALGWLLSVGTFESLWKGLLDAPADAVFAMAMVAIFARRMWLYVPLAVFLLLIREVYALFAFAVFMATLCNRFDWKDVSGYWKRAALSAVPGVVMLAWTAYLTINFQMSPIEARTINSAATSYPFYAMFQYIGIFYRTTNWTELRLILMTAFSLLLVTVLLVRDCRRLPWVILCTAPFVWMTNNLGIAIWESHGASTRITGTILLIGLMMMAYDKTILLRFMLALQAIVGVGWESEIRFLHPQLLSPHLLHEEAGLPPNPAGSPENGLIDDWNCSIEWLGAEPVCRRSYQGMWDWFHREVKPVTVAITNNTEVTWYGGPGKHPIWLYCTIMDGGGQRAIARRIVMLDKTIGPGETQNVTSYIELRRPGGKYFAEFTLWQEGPGQSIEVDRSFGRRYPISIE